MAAPESDTLFHKLSRKTYQKPQHFLYSNTCVKKKTVLFFLILSSFIIYFLKNFTSQDIISLLFTTVHTEQYVYTTQTMAITVLSGTSWH